MADVACPASLLRLWQRYQQGLGPPRGRTWFFQQVIKLLAERHYVRSIYTVFWRTVENLLPAHSLLVEVPLVNSGTATMVYFLAQ